MPSNATIMEFIKKTAEPITNKFMLAPPSASAINIRRNSTHQSHSTEPTTNPPFSATEPPPVPKRTILGKIMTSRASSGGESPSPSPSIKMTFNNVCKQTLEEVKRRNGSSSSKQFPQQQLQPHQTTRKLVENHYPIDQYSDDDRLSIESSVFEEPKSSDPIIFAASSNRSSSDSNKSHITIDTGYMSASNDTDRIFFGASEDFRSRFSSVDTQSSIDSCTSSDMPTQYSFNLQNQARCIISPLAAKRDEYEEKFTAQLSKSFSRMNSASSLLVPLGKTPNVSPKPGAVQNNCDTIRRMPPMASRNQQQQQSMAKTLQPQNSLNNSNPNGYPKSRPLPAPPIPTHDPLDADRNSYNGTTVLGAFQNGLARITSAAASTSDVMMGRKSFKSQMSAFNQKPPHAKINQRQDSTISSDSFSMTSSPGFNTKPPNMEAPLLQHATKRYNNRINPPDTVDGTALAGAKYNFPGRPAVRHDSTLSSDSVSQTSSPGYNTKLEQPLLAQAVRIHASKLRNQFPLLFCIINQSNYHNQY